MLGNPGPIGAMDCAVLSKSSRHPASVGEHFGRCQPQQRIAAPNMCSAANMLAEPLEMLMIGLQISAASLDGENQSTVYVDRSVNGGEKAERWAGYTTQERSPNNARLG